MWPFKRHPTPTIGEPQKSAPESSSLVLPTLETLNKLQTRVERLEMDNAERQLSVMNALEKVMYQLRAREDRRRSRADEDEEVETQDELFPTAEPEPVAGTAFLAKRFRRW